MSDLSAAAGDTRTGSELRPFPQIPGLQLSPTPVFPQATPVVVLKGHGQTHLELSGRRAAEGAQERRCTPHPAPGAAAMPAAAAPAPSSAHLGGSRA